MKITKYIALFFASLFFASCEDVIEVDLNTAAPRLVIDAAINWQKGTTGANQKIILSTTTDFYSNVIPKVSGATVSIKSGGNLTYVFTEIPNTGEYQCSTFKPIIDESYTLTVVYKGETYTSTETLKSVTPIARIEQKDNGGFSGKDYEIQVFFQDPIAKNFYMVKFFPDIFKAPSYSIIKDEYTNGNEKSWQFSDEDLKVGGKIAITHYGVSESYYNYMNKIISLSSSSGGGSPFQTPPATVRGNIVNQKNIDNYALGFFSLSEVDVREYTIQ
ncbi:DUF4249 domain-containing protein [Flavobacterium nackdongense]|uniref:DUF4249 domain-containing protein n=1 Tax=Flavobacterium nackdongense TaxID=2547394 RepID=A0A4V1AGK0_9FLAO|nr:DUF4249 domain-containing protein [Flavobacterium nackdongense]QBN18312.1 DUF4249 domain-containing protein [Flavobacterium nackdongense]